jgi:hypothetical protein
MYYMLAGTYVYMLACACSVCVHVVYDKSSGVVKRCLLGSSKAQELGVKILREKWMYGKRGKNGGPRAPA